MAEKDSKGSLHFAQPTQTQPWRIADTLSPSWIEDLAQAIGKVTDAQLSALGVELERGASLNADTLRRLGLPTGEAVRIARKLDSLVTAKGTPAGRDIAIAVEAMRAVRATQASR